MDEDKQPDSGSLEFRPSDSTLAVVPIDDAAVKEVTVETTTQFYKPDLAVRPDLEPGAEYALVQSLTPARSASVHNPAIWPNNLVDWDSLDDPANARNWSLWVKMRITLQLGLTTAGASFASSSIVPASTSIQTHFGVSRTVATLTLSLFVLGFAFGPLLFAPISEMYGRRISFLPAYFGFALFLVGVATADNIQTVLVCRFFAGIMASAPISNVAGCMADMYDDKSRGTAVVLYSIAVVGGPSFGPLVGASIANSHLGWRWTEYVTSFYIFFMFVVNVFLLPETFGPVILQQKASRLRHVTGNWALHSLLDEKEMTFDYIVEKNLYRPLRMLFTEPIILLISTYNAFVYGLLYLLFEAFPFAFQTKRGWTPVVASLPFLAVFIGVCVSGVLQMSFQPLFWKQLAQAKAAGRRNNPEARLPPMILGGTLFAAGLFLFGWTATPTHYWLEPVIGAMFIGAGFILIFQNSVNYLIDAFTIHAASAQAANTFLRSLAGASFPLFAYSMYDTLDVQWATSLLGFVAFAMIPIPFLFYVFGARIRARSHFIGVQGGCVAAPAKEKV